GSGIRARRQCAPIFKELSAARGLVDVDLVTRLQVVEESPSSLAVHANAASGLHVGRALVEGVTVVREVHGVRHRCVTELVADLVLDLAGHREHATRGLLAWAAGGNDDRAVGALAALLQPGALGLDIDARVCGGRARVGRRAGLLLWRWLRGRLRCT